MACGTRMLGGQRSPRLAGKLAGKQPERAAGCREGERKRREKIEFFWVDLCLF